MATEAHEQRGRDRVADAIGCLADAWRCTHWRDVPQLPSPGGVGWALFGARSQFVWSLKRWECCIICGIWWILAAWGKGRNGERYEEECSIVAVCTSRVLCDAHKSHKKQAAGRECSLDQNWHLASRGLEDTLKGFATSFAGSQEFWPSGASTSKFGKSINHWDKKALHQALIQGAAACTFSSDGGCGQHLAMKFQISWWLKDLDLKYLPWWKACLGEYQ